MVPVEYLAVSSGMTPSAERQDATGDLSNSNAADFEDLLCESVDTKYEEACIKADMGGHGVREGVDAWDIGEDFDLAPMPVNSNMTSIADVEGSSEAISGGRPRGEESSFLKVATASAITLSRLRARFFGQTPALDSAR